VARSDSRRGTFVALSEADARASRKLPASITSKIPPFSRIQLTLSPIVRVLR
jgi:hypothetical protein